MKCGYCFKDIGYDDLGPGLVWTIIDGLTYLCHIKCVNKANIEEEVRLNRGEDIMEVELR